MNSQSLAPICLFVYNRSLHTRKTVEALRNNLLASESNLIVFSDASKSESGAGKVLEVRQFVGGISGFKSVTIVEREVNLGLAKSIIQGVSNVVNEYGRAIILEDDMVTSPHFLSFMNEGLDKYAEDERVVSIHGWLFPNESRLPETFFLQGADCWGWATWKRGWAIFNPNGQSLIDELNRLKLTRTFDCNGAYPYSKMLKGQIKGVNDSWAIRWHASAFLAKKLTLYPGRSLVHNIGNDDSGTHCGVSEQYDTYLSQTKVELISIEVTISQPGKRAFEAFLRQSQARSLGGFIRKFMLAIGIKI